MTYRMYRAAARAWLLGALLLAFAWSGGAEARAKRSGAAHKAAAAKAAPAKSAAAKAASAKAAVAKPASGPAAIAKAAPPKAALAHGEGQADDDAAESAAPAAALPRSADLSADLQAILRGAQGKSSPYVALIVDATTGKALLDHDATKVVYPASVAKLFTTAAAVRTLDLDLKPATEVRLVGRGAEAELHVVGVGDPTMSHGDWAKLAAAVQQRGVTKARRLVIDGGVFDDRLPKGFDEKQTDAAYRAPVGGVMVDASTLAVSVRPGPVGEAPLVTVTPDAGGAVSVVNQARTVAGKGSSVAIATRPAGRGTEVVVSGVLSAKSKPVGSGRRRVSDASYFAGWVFKKLLEKQGIAVAGEPVFGPAGAGEAIARHQSRDWRAVVAVTNKQSHNGYAETLFKQVGLAKGGAPSTNDKSADGVRKALEGLDIRWEGVRIANGSGLYHADQVTARAVVDLLRAMARDPKGGEFRNSLAIGGVDGTLRGRLKGPDTQGKVWAKTGTLDDVSGLAGYAQSGDKSYVFAMFFNGLKSGPAPLRGLQDRLLRRLLAP